MQKVALVTGASRGIGRAIAKRLARDGFLVVVNYLTQETEAAETCRIIEAEGGNSWCGQADVRRADQVNMLFKQIQERHRRLDLLVNNAGVMREALLSLTSEAIVRDAFDTNFMSVFHCTKAALRLMVPKRIGVIINISSTAARGTVGLGAYGATKAAIESLTRTVAREVRRSGIRVLAVAPSWTDTDMLRASERGPAQAEASGSGRVASPDEIAAVVSRLAADDMTYLSGEVIPVHGGSIG